MKQRAFIVSFMLSFKIYASTYVPCSDSEMQAKTCFECGASCVMRYSESIKNNNTIEKILTVSGEGNMGNFNYDGDTPTPWYVKSSEVTKVVVDEGITSVGFNGFYHFMNLSEVELPSTLLNLEPGAFQSCPQLKSLSLPDGVNIHRASLQGTGLTSIVIPKNAKLLSGEDIFDSPYYGSTPIEKIYCLSEQKDACAAVVAYRGDNVSVIAYQKSDDGFYQIGDKLYATADLMTKGAACDNAQNCQDILDAASQGKPFEVGGKYWATLDLFASGAACTDKQNCEDILASNGAPFKVGSKIYNSMEDFALGNNVKFRIYTIDEANQVAGKTNTFSIRYR